MYLYIYIFSFRISKSNSIWKLLCIGNFLRRKKIVLVSSLFPHKSLQNPAIIYTVLCLDFLICSTYYLLYVPNRFFLFEFYSYFLSNIYILKYYSFMCQISFSVWNINCLQKKVYFMYLNSPNINISIDRGGGPGLGRSGRSWPTHYFHILPLHFTI